MQFSNPLNHTPIQEAYKNLTQKYGQPEAPSSLIDRANFVMNSWTQPCVAPYLVYLECARGAGLQLLISWFEPDLMSMLTGFLRPKGLKGPGGGCHGGHGKGGGRGHRSPAGKIAGIIADPFAAGGEALGELTGMKGRHVTDGVRHLWVFETLLERFLFWFFVIDLVSEFAYNFTSLLYKTQYCKASTALWGFGEGKTVSIPNKDVWQGAGTGTQTSGQGEVAASPAGGSIPKNTFGTFTGFYSWKNTGLTSAAITLECNGAATTVTVPSGGTITASIAASARGPASFYVRCKSNVIGQIGQEATGLVTASRIA